MKYNFDDSPLRRGTDSVKWRKFGDDVLPLWLADMDFASPEPVIRALRERVEHGVFGYPEGWEPTDLAEFRELIVDRMLRRYGWRVQPEDVIIIGGVVAAMHIACHLVAGAGGQGAGVLIQPPVYPPILNAHTVANLARHDAALARRTDGSYEVDFDVFASAIRPETRLFILSNPHNPVGRVFTRAELERMARICLERGVVICSDEIHCDLLYSGQQHVPIASIDPEIAWNTITATAPTKTFNIAGLQCSVVVIPNPDLRQRYQQARQGLVMWLNLMGQIAGQAAYRGGQEWLDQLLVYLEANRDLVYDFVHRELPGVRMAKPQGTFLAWLDCRDAGMREGPFEFFVKHARVALGDGATFGPGGEGFVRLNFGCTRATLLEALERMKRALERGQPSTASRR